MAALQFIRESDHSIDRGLLYPGDLSPRIGGRYNVKSLLLYVIHAGLRYIRGLSPVRIVQNSLVGANGKWGLRKVLS
ncbi:hypothetical protein Mal35_53220 [Gimesia maris]|uniref:hypothetical protein n=1 Tax=Gimesia maris TaxID=122 RepID=UPI00118CFC7D|nr:hypothetical protein [Gimesia maris]QDT81837.1 hypothetical protein Mal35_53220 [Gimesia maris]